MADIRCPMCSKPNPSDRDTCQYCDARLKPLIAGQVPSKPDPGMSGSDSTSDRNEPEDWLSGLRSSGEDNFDQEDSTSGEDLGTDDWLARLGGSESEPKVDEYGEEIEENTLPDWFTDAGKESTPAQDAKNIYHSDELPDWFGFGAGSESPVEPAEEDVFASTESTPSEASQPEQEQFYAGDEIPASEVPAQDLFAEFADESEQPWGADRSEGESIAEPLAEEEPGEPAPSLDWFTAGPGEAAPAQEFDPGAFGSGDFTRPAFSGEEEEASEWGTDSGESGLPAWLTSNRPESETPGEPAGEQESPGGEPDWLSRIRARQQAEQQTKDLTGEIEEEQNGPELPDWLSTFSSVEAGDTGQLPAADEPPAPPPVVSPFTNLEDEGQQAFAWSSGGLGQPAKKPAAPKEEDDRPEWLKSLHKDEEAEPGISPAFSGDEQAPDWLSSIGARPGQAEGGSVPAFVMEEGEELPSQESEPFAASAEAEGMDSIPDWLAQVRAEQEEESIAPAQAGEPTEELERANLPTWLEAMRPVEAVAPEMFKDTSDARVENAGPLAGLRGALPSELIQPETHKPPPYAVKMSLPEDQAARLEMLRGLLAEETEPRPLPSPAVLSSQLVLRLLVFAIFVLAAVYALWSGPQAVTQLSSARAPQPVIDFQSHLATIQPGAPVLVAIDFEPGFTTELEASLQAVLIELANLNSPVFTVSTSTSGAVQAERLLANINAQPARQQAPYTGMRNLGFLPGGSAGLLTFAADPANTIPVDIQGRHPWVEVSMEGEAGLASFATVIVATDRAETARTWIEQVGPGLQQNRVSLLMVTSAQVEPLVRTYYSADPQLVSGFISGLTGGAAYENLVGLPGAASSALDAFSLILLVGLLTILIGGLIGLLVGATPQPATQKPTIEEKA